MQVISSKYQILSEETLLSIKLLIVFLIYFASIILLMAFEEAYKDEKFRKSKESFEESFLCVRVLCVFELNAVIHPLVYAMSHAVYLENILTKSVI